MILSCFTLKLKEKVGGLLGGPKDMLAPPLKLLGGPGPPSSYAYGIYSWNLTSACITLIWCVMNSLFIRGKYICRIYASTFHCYPYCESNFQLLDDKEYWTFIFWFNLKDCLLPYLVLCCLTNFCQTKSKFIFYYHSAYWLKQRFPKGFIVFS